MLRTHLTLLTTLALACAPSTNDHDTHAPALDAGARAVDDDHADDAGVRAVDVDDAGVSTVDADDAGERTADAGEASDAGARAVDDAGAHDVCGTPGPAVHCASCSVVGDVVDVSHVDVLALPQLALASEDGARTLLFSDSPETPATSGILAQADVTGAARVYVYHVNGASIPKKLTIVVDNFGDSDVHMDIERVSVGDGTDFGLVGQDVTARFLDAHNAVEKIVGPHAHALLLVENLDARAVSPGHLEHAIVDVVFSAAVRVRVAMLDASTDTLAHVDALPILARDSHDRGTFVADRTLAGCVVDGASRVRLGAAGAPTGIDELSGDVVTLGGHYGVLYRIELTGPPRSLLIDPRAGPYAGAVGVDGAIVRAASSSSTQAIYVGDTRDGSVLSWMAPGGSSLPIDVLFTVP